MAKIKIKSMGFGYDKSSKLSEGLIYAGTAMIIAGIAVNHAKTQWWVARDQETLDKLVRLYDVQN